MTQQADQEVYLSVRLDRQPTALIARFRLTQGRLYARGSDLSHIGLDIGALGIRPDQEVGLDDIEGLSYDYDAGQQTVALDTREGMRTPYRIDARGLPSTGPAQAGRGLLLNYDVYARTAREAPLAAWSELRYFDRHGVLGNTGIGYWYQDLRRYVRYDTSWSSTDQDGMRTLEVGDTVTGSLNWSRAMRLGGVQWRRNFATRPDLVTFPMPELGGSSVVPSAVDVYINSIRRYSGNVPSGPFMVDNVAGITGYGQANVVTRDALGRPVSLSVPIYVDTRLLAAGLSSYSAEAGFLRRQYGWRSFEYAATPAASGTWQYGLSNTLTVQAHGEATSGVYNAGVGALVQLGTRGVLSASLAGSGGHDTGAQIGLGYQYVDSRFAIDVSTLRAVSSYSDLATAEGIPVTRATDQATITVPVGQGQTLAASYIGVRYPKTDPARIGSLSYSINVGGNLTFSLSAYKDFNRDDTHGAFLGVALAMGQVSASTMVGRQGDDAYVNASALRAPDYEGGFGWGVQAGQATGTRFGQAWTRYLGRYGEITAGAQHTDGRTEGTLDANGALILMGGTVQPARRVIDSFALVSTDGRAGVPVLNHNNEIGRTDSGGFMVVPDLNSYQQNRIDIDPLELPANAAVDSFSQTLVPQARAGVVARFGMRQQAAASVVLADEQGRPLPVGARVVHRESGEVGVVGYDSMTFLTQLVAQNHLDVQGDGIACSAEVAFTPPGDGSLPRLGPVTCHGAVPSGAAR